MPLSTVTLPVVAEGPDRPGRGMRGDGVYAAVEADPVEMQKALCEAIARLVRDGQPEIAAARRLLALERQAQPVSAAVTDPIR